MTEEQKKINKRLMQWHLYSVALYLRDLYHCELIDEDFIQFFNKEIEKLKISALEDLASDEVDRINWSEEAQTI